MPDFIYLLETRLSAAQKSAMQHIRDAARDAGMNVFLTGGAVRDLISGFPVRDLDFSVQGGTSKLKRSLEKAGAVQWGGHAETHSLFYWFPGSVRVEISSTRREDYPKPGKPVYHHATMLEDLRRRDFTANAMAISLNDGSYGLLLDPMNGIADIENRHIRLVSNYGFLEEPSRLIRAVRLAARTGWEMDERTKARYDNAKEEGVIQHLSPYLRGYELEEIGHEEDALKALRALEAEGWMAHLYSSWTSAKADVAGLESLHQLYVKFLMQGVHPDLSAAQMRLLTAKLAPKELAALKKELPCQGFVEQWEHLDEAAKEFAARLTSKDMHLASDTWKLIANYQPEPVLWLAFTSKSSPVQAKFHNFFDVWPEARQKIPTQLMAEMRITADLPEYGHLLNELFFALIDGKLETEEAMRAFLEPYSPPAPPPPVSIRRTRKSKAEVRARLLQEEENEAASSDDEDEDEEEHEFDEEHEHDEEHEDGFDGEDEDEDEHPKPVKAKKASKAVKPAKAEKAEKPAEPAAAKVEEKKSKAKPEKAAKEAAPKKESAPKPAQKKPIAAKPAEKKAAAQVKPAAAAAKAVKTPAKPAKVEKKADAAKSGAKKPAAKPVARKAPAKPAAKKATPAKVAAKKPAAKPAPKKAVPKKKK
ncbi:MAG: CCA tRNA nucleotidyltransferase [Acidobacteriaceae bacterium]